MNRKWSIFAHNDGLAGVPATCGSAGVTFSGDWLIENFYDGFDRNISAVDAAGGMALTIFDPGSRAIATLTYGSPGGPTPTDRNGNANVLLASAEGRFDEAGRQNQTQARKKGRKPINP